MTRTPKNLGASVRARLSRLAAERREDTQHLLLRYANERLLYRLSLSYGSSFVLKGAALFVLWTSRAHRATRDVDLLGFGDPTEAHVRAVFEELLRMPVPDDGVRFDPASLSVGPIREAQAYGGVRVGLIAAIETARVRIQIDVGFGDAITPGVDMVEFPALLEFPAPRLRAYPRETVVAEKLEAMVQLGAANSRMKDFFDVALLARTFAFQGDLLARAIRATFDRRQTPVPLDTPFALTAAFADDRDKRTQWSGFVRKAGIDVAEDLRAVVAAVGVFLAPALQVAASGAVWGATWPAGGPWSALPAERL